MVPTGWGSYQATKNEKLLAILLPVGGGGGRAVVTNDWCIKQWTNEPRCEKTGLWGF